MYYILTIWAWKNYQIALRYKYIKHYLIGSEILSGHIIRLNITTNSSLVSLIINQLY
jgi:hypothetical protein